MEQLSDLYVEATPAVIKVLKDHKAHYTFFENQVEGGCWVDVPFAYSPFWDLCSKS